MTRKQKLLQKILSGSKNIRFDEFVALVEAFGFTLKRIKGSHRIYRHPSVPRPLPLQPKGNGQAKPYQIHQFLELVEAYDLSLGDNADELDKGEE